MPPKRKTTFNPEEAKEKSKKARIKKDSTKAYAEAELNLLSANNSLSSATPGNLIPI